MEIAGLEAISTALPDERRKVTLAELAERMRRG